MSVVSRQHVHAAFGQAIYIQKPIIKSLTVLVQLIYKVLNDCSPLSCFSSQAKLCSCISTSTLFCPAATYLSLICCWYNSCLLALSDSCFSLSVFGDCIKTHLPHFNDGALKHQRGQILNLHPLLSSSVVMVLCPWSRWEATSLPWNVPQDLSQISLSGTTATKSLLYLFVICFSSLF